MHTCWLRGAAGMHGRRQLSSAPDVQESLKPRHQLGRPPPLPSQPAAVAVARVGHAAPLRLRLRLHWLGGNGQGGAGAPQAGRTGGPHRTHACSSACCRDPVASTVGPCSRCCCTKCRARAPSPHLQARLPQRSAQRGAHVGKIRIFAQQRSAYVRDVCDLGVKSCWLRLVGGLPAGGRRGAEAAAAGPLPPPHPCAPLPPPATSTHSQRPHRISLMARLSSPSWYSARARLACRWGWHRDVAGVGGGTRLRVRSAIELRATADRRLQRPHARSLADLGKRKLGSQLGRLAVILCRRRPVALACSSQVRGAAVGSRHVSTGKPTQRVHQLPWHPAHGSPHALPGGGPPQRGGTLTGACISQVVPSRGVLWCGRQHGPIVSNGLIKAAQSLQHHAPAARARQAASTTTSRSACRTGSQAALGSGPCHRRMHAAARAVQRCNTAIPPPLPTC